MKYHDSSQHFLNTHFEPSSLLSALLYELGSVLTITLGRWSWQWESGGTPWFWFYVCVCVCVCVCSSSSLYWTLQGVCYAAWMNGECLGSARQELIKPHSSGTKESVFCRFPHEVQRGKASCWLISSHTGSKCHSWTWTMAVLFLL